MKTISTIFLIAILFTGSIFAQSGWFPVHSDTNMAWGWNYFSDANTGYVVGYQIIGGKILPRIIKTSNAGSNWVEQMTPERDSMNFHFRCVFFTSNNTGFITAANTSSSSIGRILKTTNGGNTWNITALPVDKHMTNIFFVNSNTGYASGYQTILKTTNAGVTWVFQNPNFSYYLFAIHFTNVNTGYVAGNAGRIFKTTNGGDNWVETFTGTAQPLWGVFFIDANTGVAVGGTSDNSQNVILRTTDAGNNWSIVPYSYSTCLLWSVRFISPTTGYIVGLCSQVLKTTNRGLNWYNQFIPVNNGWGRSCFFTDANTGYLAVEYDQPGDFGYVFKTTDGGGSYVNVNPIKNDIPAQFHLNQNSPNPFNPITKIKFDVPAVNSDLRGVKGISVKLVIYDVLGRALSVLKDEQMSPGTYEVEWNASAYSSGVYFYTLSAGDFIETRKMVLLK